MTGDEWLNEFFQVVDRNRLERGIALYHSGKLNEFDINEEENQFHAHVQGSRSKSYVVEGFLLNVPEDGLPDVDDLFINCSCPDWVEFCKHAVCAVMHYANEVYDKREEPHIVQETAKEQLRGRVKEIKKLITPDMVSIATLEDGPFFENETELKNIHNIVRSKLRNLG